MNYNDFAARWGGDPTYLKAPNEPNDGYLFYNYAVEKADPAFIAHFIPAVERMIEFARLNSPSDVADLQRFLNYLRLDEFMRAYIEAALWSSVDDAGDPLDDEYSIENIAPETLAEMIDDCKRFQEETGVTSSQGGHDFWLTRNHHGSGFWDGDWPNGERLTAISDEFGEVDLCVSDNLIYG
jgi:hypothetical protein